MRPLWLNTPDDPHVWDLGFEYLWGDDLLVAPVTREGARHWSVYLPAGGWVDWWTQQRYEGGRSVEVDAPLERIPLFAREGAIIPMGPVMQHVDERPLEAVTLVVYPGDESRFVLYDDDGRTNSWRRGVHALTELRSQVQGGRVTVEIGAPRGDAGAIPAKREYTLQVRMAKVSRVDLDTGGGSTELRQASRGHVRGWWADDGWAFVRASGRQARVTLRP
jgi:alpha-glucosidase (family GH31 glycosyl hydrolase)